jgi:hypothetical protein
VADDGPALPEAHTRYLVVSGPGAAVPDADLLLPLLTAMTANGPAPAVAAQAGPPGVTDGDERTVFVGQIRGDDTLTELVSTVDDLESFVGWAAAILALEHLEVGQVGHYGVGEGRDRLLPAPIDGGDG